MRRPLQIDHLTQFLQIVKSPNPVRTDGKDIHAHFLDIFLLLPLMVLDDDLIRQTGPADIFHSLQNRIHHIQLSPLQVIILGGHPDDQIVPQRFRSFQQVTMPFMEQIIGSVCNDFFHSFYHSLSSFCLL